MYKDHLNNTYKTFGDMCLKYGIGRSTVVARLKRGWSLEKALTTPLKKQASNAKKVKDCFDNEFNSETELCLFYNIKYDSYLRYKKYGKSLKDILNIHESKKVMDHRGNIFISTAEMCKLYGIPVNVFSTRMNLGWSLEKALTVPKTTPSSKYWTTTDHLGNSFASFTEMCNFYNLGRVTVDRRLRYGWSLEKALTTPVEPKKNKENSMKIGGE